MPSDDLLSSLRRALSTVEEPELKRDIVSLNMVKKIHVEQNRAIVHVELTTPACPLKDELKRRVENAVLTVAGITSVEVEFSARVLQARPVSAKSAIPGVKHIVAVYACKGGVGKTTLSTNLACALTQTGATVGLLDADVHGPNVALMMGGKGPAYVSGENRIAPVMAHGVKTMSISYVMDENAPKIWRGPMVHGAIQQLLRDTDWGDLDYLVIDMPPGTGDAQLTVIQTVPLSGVVFVSTPQGVSLLDGAKGIGMFRKLNTPIIGLVENMSGFECPHCHEVTDIFARGGAEKEAERLNIPFLGAVPIDPRIMQGGDAGKPVVVAEPSSSAARIVKRVAEQVAAGISVHQFSLASAPENERVNVVN